MGSITDLRLGRDSNRWVSDELHNQSGYIAAMVFSGAAVKSSTPPATARVVKIVSSATVYVKVGGTAAVPAADVTDGSASECCVAGFPKFFTLDGATSVGVAAGAAAVVTLTYYS